MTGDNSYHTLYGSEWLFMIEHETRILRAYQRVDSVWLERTDDPRMPPIVGQVMPADVRRLSGAFDQAARAVIAYEVGEGVVTGTRWDSSLSEYKQNIDFLGADPALFVDASLADPAVSPEEAIRQAFSYGWGVLFEWLPTGQWLENPVTDSDVVVFYLSPDRLQLRARVQRQLYQQEHLLHTFEQPVVLDRVVALFGRYQALLSGANGEPLAKALLSASYFQGVLPVYAPADALGAGIAPENIRASNDIPIVSAGDDLSAGVAPESIAVTGGTYPATDGERLAAGVGPESLASVSSIFRAADEGALGAGIAPEGIPVVYDTIPASGEDDLNGGITVESIRVQRVA